MSFEGLSNEKINVNPLERTGKNESYYIAHIIKKVQKDVSSFFPENSKNCQNECVFEVAVTG